MSMSIKKFVTKKAVVVGTAAALVLGLSGVAFAYFTNNSTGTGSATVGSQASWTFDQTGFTGGPMFPEALGSLTTAETISYTVTNNGGVAETLNNVDIAVSPGWSHSDGAGDPACNASDFSIGGNAVGTAYDTGSLGSVASGATTSAQTVTVELVDNGAIQNSCEGVTVPLTYTAS